MIEKATRQPEMNVIISPSFFFWKGTNKLDRRTKKKLGCEKGTPCVVSCPSFFCLSTAEARSTHVRKRVRRSQIIHIATVALWLFQTWRPATKRTRIGMLLLYYRSLEFIRLISWNGFFNRAQFMWYCTNLYYMNLWILYNFIHQLIFVDSDFFLLQPWQQPNLGVFWFGIKGLLSTHMAVHAWASWYCQTGTVCWNMTCLAFSKASGENIFRILLPPFKMEHFAIFGDSCIFPGVGNWKLCFLTAQTNMEFWSLCYSVGWSMPCWLVQFVSLFQRRLERRLWDSAGFKIVRA